MLLTTGVRDKRTAGAVSTRGQLADELTHADVWPHAVALRGRCFHLEGDVRGRRIPQAGCEQGVHPQTHGELQQLRKHLRVRTRLRRELLEGTSLLQALIAANVAASLPEGAATPCSVAARQRPPRLLPAGLPRDPQFRRSPSSYCGPASTGRWDVIQAAQAKDALLVE